jgi:hypothetical protein
MPQVHHFSQSNPEGIGQNDVPALLRRLAKSIDSLGEVTVQDISFENEVTDIGLWPSMTVYFQYGSIVGDCRCGSCRSATPPSV